MITAKGFGGRAGIALALFAARGEKKPTHDELAKAVAGLAKQPVTGSMVQSWLAGRFFPVTMARLWGLARALKVDPGWLAFGEESGAPAPSLREAAPAPGAGQHLMNLPKIEDRGAPPAAAPAGRRRRPRAR